MSWNTPNGGMRFMDLTRTSPVPIVPGDEIQCRTHPNNKTITNFFHRGYGGIPENLIINICAWIILVLSFCFARRYFGNYGRIGLIDGVRKRSTYHGPTTYEGWSTTVCSEPAPTGDSHELETSQVSHTNDEGMFTWVWSTVQLSDSQISSRCGSDALHYLKFQRALILLMIVFTFLSLSIALPVNMSGTKIDKEVNPFAVTTLSNLDPGSWLVVIHITLSLLFFVIGIYVMRKYSVGLRLKESGSYISKTLMITNVPLNMCNEDTLRSHFNQAYPDKRVEDLKVSHDTEKVADLEKKKKAVSEALAYVNKYNRNNKPMKMRPWKCGFLCSHLDCCDCCETVDARSHYQNEEGSLSRKLHWAKRKARDNPLGIFFVTFGTPEDAQKVLKDHTLRRRGNGISITKNPGRSELSTALNPKDWKVKFAPPAADIYWEHLRTNGKFWLLRWVVIHIILLLFLIFFSTPSVVINNLDFVLLPLKQELGKINPLFSEFLATILLLSTAALLPVLISLSDRFLSHWTRSDANMSVMVKTFIFLLFMVLLLPSLGLVSIDAFLQWTFSVNGTTRWDCVFLPDNGAFFVNYIVTSAFVGTAMDLIRISELIYYFGCLAFSKSKAEHATIRKMSLFEFGYGTQYAWIMMKFSVIIFYSLSCPIITMFGVVYLGMKHFVDRYNIYYAYAPSKIKKKVHITAINFLVTALCLLQLCFFFFSFLRRGLRDVTIYSLVGMAVTAAVIFGYIFFNLFRKFGPFLYKEISTEVREEPEDAPENQIGYNSPYDVCPVDPAGSNDNSQSERDNGEGTVLANSPCRTYGTDQPIDLVEDNRAVVIDMRRTQEERGYQNGPDG